MTKAAALLLTATCLSASPAAAQGPPEPPGVPEPTIDERARNWHNPRGSIVLGLSGGATVGSVDIFSVGANVGYAVYHGVLPGIRGQAFFGDFAGGEVAATLTLTPPLAFYLVPFVAGEAGYRWDDFDEGMLAGVGVGAYIGQPTDRLNLRAGWIFRRYFADPDYDLSGPIVSLTLRF